ncbi:MAG TPA: Imm50 family immunity protein [Tepidisphaeraceae bacterium]|jgi:hypothetical protein|nr:Imm50 family immunity protein [Tepidisphaeraceae bacterium]
MKISEHIIGAAPLVERFGHWPSFHDAEIIRFTLDRSTDKSPSAEMLVHIWAMTSKVDDRGYYVLEKNTIVRLVFERLLACELSDFNHQNVLFGLEIEEQEVEGQRAFCITIDSSYGLSGSLACRRVVVADVRPADADGCPAGLADADSARQ